MKSVLSEKTFVPVSLVMSICAGIYMFARVSTATEVNARDMQDLREEIKALQSDVLVSLKDQQSMIYEIRSQNIMLDVKMNAVSDRLQRMEDREKARWQTKPSKN